MFRRKPTRIECKIEDLDEWHAIKREREAERKDSSQQQQATGTSQSSAVDGLALDPAEISKAKRDIIHERIGYDPKPMPQPSRLPIH